MNNNPLVQTNNPLSQPITNQNSLVQEEDLGKREYEWYDKSE